MAHCVNWSELGVRSPVATISREAPLEGVDWLKSGSEFAFTEDAVGMRRYLEAEGFTVELFKTLAICERGKDK